VNSNPTTRGLGTASRVYRLLLKLYPAAFRERYQEEMTQDFEDIWDRARERGIVSRFQTGLLLVWDTTLSAPTEWTAAINNAHLNKETFFVKIYLPSRRQDLLVGSLVSTLLVAAAIWVSYPTALKALQPPAKTDSEGTLFVVDIDEPPPPEAEEVDAALVKTPQDPAPPQLQDIPQVANPGSFTQPIQPFTPNVNIGATIKIPEHRAATRSNTEIFDPTALDQQPVPRYQARPQYPFEMRRSGVTGSVLVDFIVDSDGNVRNAFAVHSSNHDFESAAADAVKKWRFKPGRKNGHAVFTHMQVPIDFVLDSK